MSVSFVPFPSIGPVVLFWLGSESKFYISVSSLILSLICFFVELFNLIIKSILNYLLLITYFTTY